MLTILRNSNSWKLIMWSVFKSSVWQRQLVFLFKTNSQYKHTCLRRNKQQHPTPCILAISCLSITREVQRRDYCLISLFLSFFDVLLLNVEYTHISTCSLNSLFCFKVQKYIHPTWNLYLYFFLEVYLTFLCAMCQSGAQALIFKMLQRFIEL